MAGKISTEAKIKIKAYTPLALVGPSSLLRNSPRDSISSRSLIFLLSRPAGGQLVL